jgi:hypothetical protein
MSSAVRNRFAATAILVIAILGGCGGEQSASEREGGNLSIATGGTSFQVTQLDDGAAQRRATARPALPSGARSSAP